MRHASLFSGIGGPEVAAAMLGWENVFHCEINPFGRKVLEYWFPESESYEDITKTDFSRYRGQIDVLTGGFPCQPFSYAGKRGGQQDNRYLWPEMLRVIDQIRPTWVVGENVAGITTMVESCEITDLGGETTLFEKDNGVHRFRSEHTFTIERICRDLESKGYSVQPVLIPACAVGAPHRRDRIFIIAHNTDSSYDLRKSGKNESKGAEERLSERNAVRKPGESSDLRSEDWESAENALRDGCLRGQTQEQECEWNEWHVGAGDSKRLCAEERLAASHTDCERRGEIHKYIQSEQSEWEELICYGRIQNVADSGSKGLEGKDKSRSKEGGEWLHIWRDLTGCYRKDSLRPEGRWKAFPSVSPVHRRNDGIPFDVDSLAISFGQWKVETIKAYGNAIVPQVMYRIFECIDKLSYGNH